MQIIKPTGGGGVTSCLSVRLHDTIAYHREKGCWPDKIDSSRQFLFYQDVERQDISSVILGHYTPHFSEPPVEFDHGWQFAWYDEIGLTKLAALAARICPMSDLVGNRSYTMMQKLGHRTAVLYRGNDKALDIPRTHYQAMIEMAIESQSTSFLVQTDEEDFYQFFKERFPDTICYPEIPRIRKDPDRFVMPEAGHRAEFCVNFLAALRAIAQADKLILNTGNTGIWTMLFRGHTNQVWQATGRNQQRRKLNAV